MSTPNKADTTARHAELRMKLPEVSESQIKPRRTRGRERGSALPPQVTKHAVRRKQNRGPQDGNFIAITNDNKETGRVPRSTLQKGDATPETQLRVKRRILKPLSKSIHSSLSIKIYHLR